MIYSRDAFILAVILSLFNCPEQ